MNKPYALRVMIGSVGQKLKMLSREVEDRINNPDKYYNMSLEKGRNRFFKFAEKLEEAEKILQNEMVAYGKKNMAYPKDHDYVFDHCQIVSNCFYCCIYKKLIPIPS